MPRLTPRVLRLGVLDQSPVPAGADPAQALRNTIDLARLADDLGYTRYWLAEHHNTAGLAGSSPEVLIGHVAAATTRIRVGSGGVMLPHYSPLKVAENFNLLSVLYPGRIDLGIGRAPGSDPLAAFALQRQRSSRALADDFPQQLAELLGWLGQRFDAEHPFASVRPTPLPPTPAEVWLLGSSGFSGAYAAHLGLPFCFAHFISPEPGPEVVAFYRDNWQATGVSTAPTASVAVSVICAATDAEAERVASSVSLWRLRLEQGDPGPVPSLDEALAYPYTELQQRKLAHNRRRLVLGGPERVRDQLTELAATYGVDEVLAVTICHDHQARRRSYELLAEAFDLEPAGTPVAAEGASAPGA